MTKTKTSLSISDESKKMIEEIKKRYKDKYDFEPTQTEIIERALKGLYEKIKEET